MLNWYLTSLRGLLTRVVCKDQQFCVPIRNQDTSKNISAFSGTGWEHLACDESHFRVFFADVISALRRPCNKQSPTQVQLAIRRMYVRDRSLKPVKGRQIPYKDWLPFPERQAPFLPGVGCPVDGENPDGVGGPRKVAACSSPLEKRGLRMATPYLVCGRDAARPPVLTSMRNLHPSCFRCCLKRSHFAQDIKRCECSVWTRMKEDSPGPSVHENLSLLLGTRCLSLTFHLHKETGKLPLIKLWVWQLGPATFSPVKCG